MFESPKFRFAFYEGGCEHSPSGREYKAVGLSIKERNGPRLYRMTLPIEPPLPTTTDFAALTAAGMESLHYLCANLPDEEG